MIRFGLIGSNFIVDNFVNAGREHPLFEASAVYSRTEERGQWFANKMEIPLVFTDLEEMYRSGTIDAVYVASPNSLHYEQTLYFLERRIPVLLEKPMALNCTEVENLMEAAKKYDTLLLCGLKNMFEPRLLAVPELLSKIGPVRRVYANCCQYSSRYDNLKSGTVENAFRPDMGGGAAMDLGIYVIGPAVHQFGMPDTISVTGKKVYSGVDGQGVITLGYKEMDAVLSFAKTFAARRQTEICGEKGNMYVDFDKGNPIVIKYNDGSEERISYVQDKAPMYYEIAEFIDCMQNGKKESPLWTTQDNLSAQMIMDLYRKQIGVVYPGEEK